MTHQSAAVDEAAQRLLQAQRDSRPCPPVRDLICATDTASAYAVQQQLTQHRVTNGAIIVGRKIGLTSPAVQQQLGVDQPDFGVLFADMDWSGRPVPSHLLLQPKIEAELAFILGEDLSGESLDIEQVRAAVTSTRAALEIVDSRITGWDITYADTVADNASAGLYVLGEELPRAVEPVSVVMEMAVNGVIVSTGNGGACLGDPLNALLWLARTAHEFGDPLRAGQVVLSGALGPMAPVQPGDKVEARIYASDIPAATATAAAEFEQACP
ncbi:2-keto-4-pentenoate hydratase [Gordonia sp. FQ]|uniref:2-keto-4-pentenoate hydratase n=1 Tax=Gordonia sp. FQ TaxID=3446634 RepID=UPI003F841EAC